MPNSVGVRKNMNIINLPEAVENVIKQLEAAGYEAYAVGGCVRDCLLGLTPYDWDVTTSAPPEKTMSIFGKSAIPTGLQFGTVSVKSDNYVVEVTTFRTDGVYTDNRRPDSIAYASSLPEDLSRRDYTINAIAYSLSGEIIDPFNGIRDLNNKLIRAVGAPRERFEEDALRMFRGLRIAAKLDFSIHPNTFSAIYEKAHLAAFLSAERIKDELKKFLVCPNTYMITCVFESGLMKSFGVGNNCPDFENLSSLPADGYSRLCAMCYLLEKEGVISGTKRFLEDLRFDRNSIKMAESVVEILTNDLPDNMVGWKRLLSSHGQDVCITAALVAKTVENFNFAFVLRQVIDSGECWSTKSLAIDGNDLIKLGYSGKRIGEELEKLLMYVIEHPEKNQTSLLIEIAKQDLADN
ncbi:MAG: CCA tRNA nucleotidyltransferase [Ruminococcaceae bacterium]|nr:CCA tRNA nucleotidyltransferase [Oscillospiraceae bacterium]